MSTIRTLPSGKFQAIVRVSGHKPKYKTFSEISLAHDWSLLIEAELRAIIKTEADDWQDMTFSEAVDRYIVDINQYHKSFTQGDQYRAKALKKVFGKYSLVQITPQLISDYKNSRLENVTSGTVRRELGYVQRVFAYLRKDLHFDIPDLFKMVRLPEDSPARDRIPTDLEIGLILDKLSPVMQDIVVLASETAMRRGEITRIRAEHLNVRNKTLLIPITKTDKPRTIPLSPKAYSLLCEYASVKRGKLFNVQPNSVSQAFRRACEDSSIKGIVFHSLRHKRVTELFEMGWNQQQVRVVSGHSTSRMLDRYTHLQAINLVQQLW